MSNVWLITHELIPNLKHLIGVLSIFLLKLWLPVVLLFINKIYGNIPLFYIMTIVCIKFYYNTIDL